MNDLISVIIPVYNVEKYLEKCINSVINQTYKNLEIILVNDGSTDNCPNICDEFAKKDSRIRVIHKQNGGLSSARNAGLDIANGQYIGFVDSDDYIHTEMYQKLYEALISQNADLSICSYEEVTEKGKSIDGFSPIKDEILDANNALLKLNQEKFWYYVVVYTKLYNKNIFKDIRFPESKINEDQFIVHEVFYNCKKIVTIPNKLYYYVQRNGSITKSKKTIKNFDEIYSMFARVEFYNSKKLNSLIPGAVKVCELMYDNLRMNIKYKNLSELKQILLFDKKVKNFVLNYSKSNIKKFKFNFYTIYLLILKLLRFFKILKCKFLQLYTILNKLIEKN